MIGTRRWHNLLIIAINIFIIAYIIKINNKRAGDSPALSLVVINVQRLCDSILP